MDLMDTYKIFHANTKEYTFSGPHGIFPKTDHILSHKANLNRYKINWNNPCILSDYPGLK